MKAMLQMDKIDIETLTGKHIACEAQGDIAHARSVCKPSPDGLVRKLYLERCFCVQAEVQISRGYIDHRCEGGCSPVKTELHGAQPELDLFIEGLVRFHGAHGAETCVAAALRKNITGDQQKKSVNNSETLFHA